MDESARARGGVGTESRMAFVVTMTTSGGVAVALGAILATSAPVLAAVLVGLPSGLTAWMVARRVLGRAPAYGRSLAGPGADSEAEAGRASAVGSEN